jgi:hypothetical protein
MKPFVIATAGAVIAIIGFFFAWDWVFPSGALRYRLTIDVEADGTIHTGSGVIEVSFARQGWSDTQTLGMKPSIKGEAIAVDLGARGVLFALLKGVPTGDRNYVSAPPAMAVKEFKLAPSVGSLKGEDLPRLSKISTRAEVPVGRLPMIVRFRDLNDPMSVEQVDPGNLEKSFGGGARIVRATIETTRDAVTWGIERRLPWLTEYQSKLLDGRRIHTIEAPNRLANSLGSGSFKIRNGWWP